jgi:hypothetical protein
VCRRWLKGKVSTERLPESPTQIFACGCMSMSGQTAQPVRCKTIFTTRMSNIDPRMSTSTQRKNTVQLVR